MINLSHTDIVHFKGKIRLKGTMFVNWKSNASLNECVHIAARHQDLLLNGSSWKFRQLHRKTPVLDSLFSIILGPKGLFLIKLQALWSAALFNRDSAHVLSCGSWDIFKNNFFTEHSVQLHLYRFVSRCFQLFQLF